MKRVLLGLFFLSGMCLGIWTIASGLDLHLGRFIFMGGLCLVLNTYGFKTNLPAKL